MSHNIYKGKPEEGKVYALTGGPKAACIANGNTWADSEVKTTHILVWKQGSPYNDWVVTLADSYADLLDGGNTWNHERKFILRKDAFKYIQRFHKNSKVYVYRRKGEKCSHVKPVDFIDNQVVQRVD